MLVPLPAAFLGKPLAHRAYHDRAKGRPENSIGAVRAAIEAGYGIEIDVQVTCDGVAVVFHDEAVERLTTGTGLVRDKTLAQMQALSVRHSADPVPTLAQVLEQIGGRVPLLIEIKDQTGTMTETDGVLEAATAAALSGYAGPVAVMSFNPHSVARMARLAPHIPRGLTTAAYGDDWAPLDPARCDVLREIPDYDRTFSSFISHEVADLGRPRVADLKAKGAAILCWTVRSAKAEAEARRVAQNITFEGYAA
jgi:glycerophosphoryl diester phosphodiesterase